MKNSVFRKILVRFGYNRFKRFLEQCKEEKLTYKQVKQKLTEIFPDLDFSRFSSTHLNDWCKRLGVGENLQEFNPKHVVDKLIVLLGDRPLKEYLQNLYVDKQLSSGDIAKRIIEDFPELKGKIHKDYVLSWLDACDIPRRDMKEASDLRWEKEEEREKARQRAIKQFSDPEARKRHSEITKKLLRDPEVRKRHFARHSEILKKSWENPELRKRQSEIMKKILKNPEIRKRLSETSKEKWSNPEFRKRQSEILKKLWEDSELRKRQSEISKKMWENPELRKLQSEISKERWENPEFRKRQIEHLKNLWEARDNVRSSLEFKVEEMLKHLGIKYDYLVPINLYSNVFCVPDFILENKLLIECQGEYWHGLYGIPNETVKGNQEKDIFKADVLRQKGYKILYLWEPDINNYPEKCMILIQKFINGELEHDFHSVNYDENGNYNKKYSFPY